MPEYLHGAYGHLDDSVVQDVVTSETVPVYFGTAPVGLVRGWEDADVVNVPVKISSLADARAKIGHSEDFADYTLCEAVAAHFDTDGDGVGPIYVVNVLDPSYHRKAADTERNAVFANGRATVATDTAILDTLRVMRPALEGTPQEAKLYDADPEYAGKCAEIGVYFEDDVYGYEPNGVEIPKETFDHDGIYYVGIVFTPPEGATACKIYQDGELFDDIADLSTPSDSVLADGTIIEWYPFADGDGNPYWSRVYEMRFEWTGGDVAETVYRLGRNTLDYVEGADYTLDYNANNNSVVLSSVDERIPDGIVPIAYREMDPEAVTADDIVGMVTSDGVYSGIESLALLYQEQFVVPNLLAAPGWSHEKKVYDALVDHSTAINGHWDAFVVADLPLVDEEGGMVDTIDKAIDWKTANNYSSERAMACWPMAQDADGRRFHISTLVAATSLRVDQDNGGVPFESPSNKAVYAVKQFFGDNSRNRGFDQQTANTLNEKGITTVVGWAGEWVLWGPHTAAYEFGNPSIDPRGIFSTNMRMLMHITNSFQLEWADEIDSPMTRALRDRIVNREQAKLDGYVTVGALIGAPRVYFQEVENPVSNLMEGDFRWDISTTPTPPLKSASAYVSYTDAGFVAYFEEGGEA